MHCNMEQKWSNFGENIPWDFSGNVSWIHARQLQMHFDLCLSRQIGDERARARLHIWALTRAPDLYWNIHQLITSFNNRIQPYIKVSKRIHLPDELSARSLKQLIFD